MRELPHLAHLSATSVLSTRRRSDYASFAVLDVASDLHSSGKVLRSDVIVEMSTPGRTR